MLNVFQGIEIQAMTTVHTLMTVSSSTTVQYYSDAQAICDLKASACKKLAVVVPMPRQVLALIYQYYKTQPHVAMCLQQQVVI